MARTTIDDVAAAAGVSIKTVSRVLNDEPGVRSETRNRVRDAIASLSYRPSLPARSLAGKRSNLLGLVYDNPSANYVFDVQSGAMARCRNAHLRLFIQSCNDLGGESVEEVLAMIDQTHVDGLVVTPPLSSDPALISALDERRLPYVRLAPDDTSKGGPCVIMDDEAAAHDMTAHLLELGHRRIGFVAGHPDHPSSRLRRLGYQAALDAAEIGASQPIEQGYNDTASGYEAGRRLLSIAERPTAIFASNDDMAAGVVQAAHELGIDVPRQLSVAGFDDSQIAAIVWPALTTIRQPAYEMAFTAAGLLIDLIRGRPAPARTELAYTLVQRGSTAEAP
ncbi:LacI family DNA-binding transcriptional regulator [Sphingosinicella sp. BN140058]|uniref:LacI family DNA-binding transcriptional regulator n=1 Tax=Sphingosinicella sp. BN140058 TaxID=1892855 RepID=UPI001980817F|nr:LacI family DNA-binding transcriptional regulator [Sphingosinicella sp. BN140058]